MKYKAQIDKIKNDEGGISYQVYYYYDEEDDWRLEVPFKIPKHLRKLYSESFDDLRSAYDFLDKCGVYVEKVNECSD